MERALSMMLALVTAGVLAGCSGSPDPSAAHARDGSPSLSSTSIPSESAAPPSATASPTGTPAKTPPKPPSGGKPGSGNTGVPAGTALTVVNGDQTYSTAGQVITGMDFHGWVKVTGSNITFRKCVFRGRSTTANGALLDARKAVNLVVEDSELVPSNPSAGIDGSWARNTSFYRVNVHGATDGFKAESNVLIQDSYIHDMQWFASDPNQGGGPTHNDGVQSFEGDTHITLRHNTIDLSSDKRANAAWQSSSSDSRAEGNWLDGGGCTLNIAHEGGPPVTGVQIVNNRFGRKSFFDCPILISTQTTLSQNSGNVWDDTGKPIPKPEQHD